MKRLMPFGLATVLFILFISFNFKPVPLADFGASDPAVPDMIFGKAKPGGKLPFELPSSMEAVRNQKEDLPYGSNDPLSKFGFGLGHK